MLTKQHVLDEIRKTAEANGGKPFGYHRFENETGIRYCDWYGIYWTKWSDALREAGYRPNKMVSAFDNSFVIEKLISLIRENPEKPKWPTDGELRMKRSGNKDFPSLSVFYRIGKTNLERAKSILAYCQNKPEYQDVIDCCKKVCDASTEKTEYDSGDSETEWGVVYLMKSGRRYKIGMTKNPVGKRQYDLGIILPEPLKLVHVIKTDDPDGIEDYWHERFKEKRRGKGEWFDLSSSDVKAFKRWKKIQ